MLFLVLLAAGITAAALKADPIVWSGSPIVTSSQCPGCPYGQLISPSESENSVEADLDVEFGSSALAVGASSAASLESAFVLPYATGIDLAAAVNYNAFGTSCNDVGCAGASWTFEGEFSGSLSIVDSGGHVDLTVPFGSSGTITDVGLSDNESGLVDLAAGSYALIVNYSDSNNSIGDSFSNTFLDARLVDPEPVPEPSYVALIAGFAILAGAIRSRGGSRRFRRVLPLQRY
jgi:hypothetical protein